MNKDLVHDLTTIMPLMHRKFFKNVRRHEFKKHTMVLMNIVEDEGKSMTHYCDKFSISKPNFTKVIKELIDEGYVKREPDPGDRRITTIHMTDQGKEEVKRRKQFVYNLVEKRLSELSEEDRIALHEHILGFQSILKKL